MSDYQLRNLSDAPRGMRSQDGTLMENTLVREPLQDRSRRTLERLVASAARLLEASGPDAVTVTGVTREARTSVGAFYARFSGKEEMVRYLGERWLGEALEQWRAVASEVESEGVPGLRRGMTTLAALYLSGPARRLALLHGHDDPNPGRLRRFEDRVAETLAAGQPEDDQGGELGPSPQTRFLRAVALVAGVRELGIRAIEGGGASAGLGPGTLAEIMVGVMPGIPSAVAPDGGESARSVADEILRMTQRPPEVSERSEHPVKTEEPDTTAHGSGTGEEESGEEEGEPDVFDVWG